ncbi:DNA polymerase epsilon catalytic subunit 1 [Lutzomyia longipalpis]|uniref:DNA polymerase epsilon catalytic subunit 1 n=1 Tax=Lutzomyia longipalpis TaxID=7200 RepID=UPI002483F5BD|nr:DNA polymerase epsilon catalytic subunit 1 [Lutzomyia longipalpis]XP_055677959.1 DNA polymerase epsilon catalytic subunit 1 [Lutzomyia longipalpis]XP_055677960.1 DNA polymerase epsilon catalytic subunit 1 [Lutzomyia longipalpis]XP_055677961.1 DNA polymerase epsilon catalytic subunit 1 [Lutzomyia longipalpis]
MSVNTGSLKAKNYVGNSGSEFSFKAIQDNERIDFRYGFKKPTDSKERNGYLLNLHSAEVLNDDRQLVAGLDMYFLEMTGARFKATIVYQPYFFVLPKAGQFSEVHRFLDRKYAGHIAKSEAVEKEDLELPNHLIGLKQNYIKLSFHNLNALHKVRRELLAAVKKNQENAKNHTNYMQLLAEVAGTAGTSRGSDLFNSDYMESIVDIREHDIPYHVRVCIDLSIFCGNWYTVTCYGRDNPTIKPCTDIIDRPDPIVLAFDIETTKLPLKFPDANTDQIIMISYMIDGQGYLITNREIISADVKSFEYTPKAEFEATFTVFNEPNEKATIEKFFGHINEVKPHIFSSYNGDFFDWPFLETRAAVYDIDMKQEIGFSKNREGYYLSRPAVHLDCLNWVKRDSYLPVGSQGLKAVAKAKLRYDPVELDPEEICSLAVKRPQVLCNYSVSDAVATYYLYMKYVHPFIFALATIIPLEPDEVLRKGSGTLCENLLMVQGFHANVIFPNKQVEEVNKIAEGYVLDSETYVGGHVEALESGVFRADIPYRFRIDPEMIATLQADVPKVLHHAIAVEKGVPMDSVTNLSEVSAAIGTELEALRNVPNRIEHPVIYHLDVGAMYPNIILTNRLQPYAMVNETNCAVCDFNEPTACCKRNMTWSWRGEMLPATKSELQRIQQQLETETFPPLFPGGPPRAFNQLSREDQVAYEKKRLNDYCKMAYKKRKTTRLETKTSTVCQKENSFYVDTVRSFRDRRYEYKEMTKVAKAAVVEALKTGDATEIKAAKGREVLYDSLQLAHKCILNSFYGYVMRRGARWHSMPMGGIVCLTGANIIRKAREIIEKVGRPLELDTDGIWCILPASFPQNFTVRSAEAKGGKFIVSYPNAILNAMVKEHFTNEQYHELVDKTEGERPKYEKRAENSIFFEVDGPYLAMVLPAAKEEGKKLKKRYAVFNFDGSIAELKGFEVKRRGELQLIKNFQSSVFDAFLQGSTLEESYGSAAKVANYWLDVLYSKGESMPDSELFELISENRSMSRKLADYGAQKSTSISTAKRLAEFLGDQMIKDAGLSCKYIISAKPEGAPVTERAIPLAIFQSEASVRRHYLSRWLKDPSMGDADIRDVLDWNYYIERLGGTIQKIITIPAVLQGLSNPVERVAHPEWLHKKILQKEDVFKQRKIDEIFAAQPKPSTTMTTDVVADIEDLTRDAPSTSRDTRPISIKRKRQEVLDGEESIESFLGTRPPLGPSREEVQEWVKYQKKKWMLQLEQRALARKGRGKQQRIDEAATRPKDFSDFRHTKATIGGFLRKTQSTLLESTWEIIQIAETDYPGNFVMWILINGEELHRIRLTVPRVFYINQRTPLSADLEDAENAVFKKVHRILPRSSPVYHLYRYQIPEQTFQDRKLDILIDLTTPDIEGIYETQTSLQFRTLVDLGCKCAVQKGDRRRTNTDNFSLEQLEFRSDTNRTYLQNYGQLKKIFLYQHSSASGKREMWGVFVPATKKATILVLDTVRTNQMPNLRTLYGSEVKALMERNGQEKLSTSEMDFDVIIETDAKNIHKNIQRILSGCKHEIKGPTLLFLQVSMGLNQLTSSIPQLMEFPQVQIHITDELSLLSAINWQQNGCRSIIRHFLNLPRVVESMLRQCRYYHIPIGNMPTDPILFGADLFFARYLQKNKFILWCSKTNRPDLGGRETDDSRLLTEFDDGNSRVQNRSNLYPSISVVLNIENLAVSALLQSNRIQEAEGAFNAVSFDMIPQGFVDEMLEGRSKATYDESSHCNSTLRVMRLMVNGWLRDISLNRSIFSDTQVMHFYRWIKSPAALLYDPALRRTMFNLVRKYFLQLLAEFQRLGATIIFADFNRIIINTGKESPIEAINYTDYICQNIRNKEMFHGLHLAFQQSWKYLLWIDNFNFGGIRIAPATDGESDAPLEIEMAFNIVDQLPKEGNCGEYLEKLISGLLTSLATAETPEKAFEEHSHRAFTIVEHIHKKFNYHATKPALQFVTALNRILSVAECFTPQVESLHRNLLKLIGIGEFSEAAKWKDTTHNFTLMEVICKACNHCRDLNLHNDPHRALKDGVPVWLCSQCLGCYSTDEIEGLLLEIIQRKLMSYTLQDVKCVICKQIKLDNMTRVCECMGAFTNLLPREDIQRDLESFLVVAEEYRMPLLENFIKWIKSVY